jgi:PAS domain S-box-containing protein
LDERALFVRGPVVVFKWRNAGGWPVEYVSANAEEVFGHAPEAFRAGTVKYADVVHAEDLPRVGEEVATAADSEVDSFVHEPYRIVHRDGSVRWLHDVTQILRGEDGVPTHFLGYVVDITDRMRAEEEKRVLERQLLHSQKLESLGLLAGGVAHDFNNLLTGILGETSLLRRRIAADDPEADVHLERVEILATRAAELTRQLLAYSGRGRFVVEATDLPTVVREMSSILETAISKMVDLHLDLEAVPPVRADRAQLQQVVMNLITNASDALEDRPGRVTLRTYVSELTATASDTLPSLGPGRYVVLEVSDDGVGMSDETRARIFEPFFSTKATGRGLGMAALLGILRGHRGGIRVRSAPGRGATFTVFLPACDEAVVVTARAPRVPWRGQGTVLIVDDEASIRALAQHVFEDLGLAAITAANGAEAVALFRERHADIALVLLDLVMPVMGGAETLRALKAIDPEVPVVMSSGYDSSEAINGISTHEIVGFLQKPYHPDEIERMVRGTLGTEMPASAVTRQKR